MFFKEDIAGRCCVCPHSRTHQEVSLTVVAPQENHFWALREVWARLCSISRLLQAKQRWFATENPLIIYYLKIELDHLCAHKQSLVLLALEKKERYHLFTALCSFRCFASSAFHMECFPPKDYLQGPSWLSWIQKVGIVLLLFDSTTNRMSTIPLVKGLGTDW